LQVYALFLLCWCSFTFGKKWNFRISFPIPTFNQSIGKFTLFFISNLILCSRNVGFLKYYTMQNIPNILITLPSLCLFGKGMKMLNLDWRSNAGWMLLWTFSVVHCLAFCNVQILTRLLSPLPPVYWTLGRLWKQKERAIPLTMVFYGAVGIFLFAAFYPPA
jgi:hypothetical protein